MGNGRNNGEIRCLLDVEVAGYRGYLERGDMGESHWSEFSGLQPVLRRLPRAQLRDKEHFGLDIVLQGSKDPTQFGLLLQANIGQEFVVGYDALGRQTFRLADNMVIGAPHITKLEAHYPTYWYELSRLIRQVPADQLAWMEKIDPGAFWEKLVPLCYSIDTLSPVGRGTRGMLVGPPKSGKTTQMRAMATALSQDPDTLILLCLVNERPEEEELIREWFSIFPNVEIYSSTFGSKDQGLKLRTIDLALQRAAQYAASGGNVVILLDSMTRLFTAYSEGFFELRPEEAANSGLIEGGGNWLGMRYARYFASLAANYRLKGQQIGTVTLWGTALDDNGRLYQFFLDQFKGTVNAIYQMSRREMAQANWPPSAPGQSGAREPQFMLNTEDHPQRAALLERFVLRFAPKDMTAELNVLLRLTRDFELTTDELWSGKVDELHALLIAGIAKNNDQILVRARAAHCLSYYHRREFTWEQSCKWIEIVNNHDLTLERSELLVNFCGAAFLTDQVSFERATEWIQIACEEDLSESTLSVDWLEIFRIINTILRSSERDGHEVTEEVLPVTGAAVNLIQEEGVEPIGARPLLVANGVYRHPNDEEKFAALRELVQESLEASEKASRRAEAAEARSLKAEEAAKEDRQKATVAIAEARHATARAEEAIQSSQARMRFVLADEDDPQPQQLDEQTGDEDLTPDEIIRRLKLTGYKVTAKSTRQHGKLKAS